MCKSAIATTVEQLHKYFRLVHGVYERQDFYTCAQGTCRRTFGYKFIYNNHLALYHAADIIGQLNVPCQPIPQAIATNYENIEVDDTSISNDTVSESSSVKLRIDIKMLACKFICEANS